MYQLRGFDVSTANWLGDPTGFSYYSPLRAGNLNLQNIFTLEQRIERIRIHVFFLNFLAFLVVRARKSQPT